MPQRFLRPGITTSSRWNSVDWFEQSFYIRILTLVDDAGRYDARLPILYAHCFPLDDGSHRQLMAAARSRLQDAGLIEIYEIDGKEFLQVTRWQERMRNKSKWPEPNGSFRQPMAADGSRKTLPSPSPDPIAISPSPSPAPSETVAVEFPTGFPKTEEEAVAMVALQGIPEDLTRKTWQAAAGRGGRDSHDVPIRHFTHHLKAAEAYERERNAKTNTQPGKNGAGGNRVPDYSKGF